MRDVIAFVLFVLLAPATAFAGELEFDVEEDAQGVTVKVRGAEVTEPKKVITSRTGMLFFFEGKAKTKRLRPVQKHRIAYAQVGQTGNRVAVRFAQRERARGSLGAFVTTEPVDGGVDIRILDRQPGDEPEPAAGEAEVVDAEATARPDERGTALAALEASLGQDPPRAPEPTKPPVPADEPEADEEETEPDVVAAIAPELEAPPAPEAAPSSSSSTGLRTLLAVALMISFGGAAVWWIKRRKQTTTAPALDVVSRVGIGPKQSVVLINAGGRQLLIGATEKRIEVLTELSPTAELRVPSVIDRPREPFAAARAPIAPPSDPTAPAKIAAFKARLEQALGRELTGEHPLVGGEASSTPPHLRLLQNDPRWGNEEGVA